LSMAMGTLFLMLYFLIPSAPTRSIVVYSPDHTMAARLETWDAGGMGGGDYVKLFRWHGLDSTIVYTGGWHSVTASDVHWKSDSELEIFYSYARDTDCKNAPKVAVTCILRAFPSF
jgi:hypothetical protein